MRKLHMSQETPLAPDYPFSLVLSSLCIRIADFEYSISQKNHNACRRKKTHSELQVFRCSPGWRKAPMFTDIHGQVLWLNLALNKSSWQRSMISLSASSNNWLTLVCLYKAQRKCWQVPPCNRELLGIQESKESRESVQKGNWLIRHFKDCKCPPNISNVKTNHVWLHTE